MSWALVEVTGGEVDTIYSDDIELYHIDWNGIGDDEEYAMNIRRDILVSNEIPDEERTRIVSLIDEIWSNVIFIDVEDIY